MLEIGKVISLDNKKKLAKVEFDRKKACENCNMCLQSPDKMKVFVNATNKVDAKVEDTVEVSLKSSYVLSSALIVYILPVLLILFSLILLRNSKESYQLLAIGVSLLVGFSIAVFCDRKIFKNSKTIPIITRIVKEEIEEKDVHKEDIK